MDVGSGILKLFNLIGFEFLLIEEWDMGLWVVGGGGMGAQDVGGQISWVKEEPNAP